MFSIMPYGDSAILVNLDQIIDSEINKTAIALSESFSRANIPGLDFIIPAYCSVTIGYNPLIIPFRELKEKIESICLSIQTTNSESRKLWIPVCYDEQFALDIEELGKMTGLVKNEIIAIHTNDIYRVYMLGFLPGFAYMGKTDKRIYCRRKNTPRKKVKERSVGLAGSQTGIYPTEAPGGWQIIGNTPIDIVKMDKENPFLFSPGDMVKFYSISKQEYDQIREKVITNTFKMDSLYE